MVDQQRSQRRAATSWERFGSLRRRMEACQMTLLMMGVAVHHRLWTLDSTEPFHSRMETTKSHQRTNPRLRWTGRREITAQVHETLRKCQRCKINYLRLSLMAHHNYLRAYLQVLWAIGSRPHPHLRVIRRSSAVMRPCNGPWDRTMLRKPARSKRPLTRLESWRQLRSVHQ